ncbi:MAG TPA: bifunctional hydroxymethylpyrimidine kinase/phosphomethylpyrimidine kinase [Blastocatellia bacterium]|nr:bifunctional hydroxymethylpyrimidine kinase/phosphomethylpyrimidine kinase [Blastocatellia bacterium]
MSIAGFDPSGGAGILADIKTIASFGCHGVGVLTSTTFQNTEGISGAVHQSPEAVSEQMRVLWDDFDISALKTGMLPSPEIVKAIVAFLEPRKLPWLVVDPVLKSTSGFNLSEDSIGPQVSTLFPLASIVTPNAVEAGRIAGIEVKDRLSMERAAVKILRTGARSVLVKGGDLDGAVSVDVLVDSEGTTEYEGERIHSTSTHGTGCVLSSAIACLLAQGRSVRDSVRLAKSYVAEAIRTAQPLGRGNGPLNLEPAGVFLGDLK